MGEIMKGTVSVLVTKTSQESTYEISCTTYVTYLFSDFFNGAVSSSDYVE
jgi:hypothetical protein